MSVFFLSSSNIKDEIVKLSEAESHHLMNVLRKKIGDSITVVNGSGLTMQAKIDSIQQKRIEIKIFEKKLNEEPPPYFILYQAILKNPRMDWLIEKVVELGVSSIIPFLPERSVIKIDSDKEKASKLQRWERIALAALKQSNRTILPQIGPILPWKELLQKLREEESIKILFDLSPQHPFEKLSDLFEPNSKKTTYSILIGPEGGFNAHEIESALERNFHLVSLGNQTLRAETAALKAISIFNFLKDEKMNQTL